MFEFGAAPPLCLPPPASPVPDPAHPHENARVLCAGRTHAGLTRAGRWSKAVVLEAVATHGAGVVHTIRMDVPAVLKADALEHARKRFPRLPQPRMDDDAVTPPPGEDLSAWLRRVHVVTKDHVRHAPGMFRVPKSLVGTGAREHRVIQAEAMLLQWARLWEERRVRLTFRTTVGFGLRSTGAIASGTSILSGVVEADLEDPVALVNPAGSLYGPLSCIQAACRGCSNVRFERVDALVWRGVTTRHVPACAPLTAPYPVCGATCLQCGGRL